MAGKYFIALLVIGAVTWDCYWEGGEYLEQSGLWQETRSWKPRWVMQSLVLLLAFSVASWRQPLRVLYCQLAIWLWIWKVSRDLPHAVEHPGLCASAALLVVAFVNMFYAVLCAASVEDLAADPTDTDFFLIAVITPLLHMVFMVVYQRALLQPYQGIRFFGRHILTVCILLEAYSLTKLLQFYTVFAQNVLMDLWRHSLLLAVHLTALTVSLCCGQSAMATVLGAERPASRLVSHVSLVTSVITPSWVKELLQSLLASFLQFV